jgi:hypothetical protein
VDLVIGLQRARLVAMLRGLGSAHTDDLDALMLIGLAVGLEFAARHPETAARMLIELEPPLDTIDRWLEWVVEGSSLPDPNMPTH